MGVVIRLLRESHEIVSVPDPDGGTFDAVDGLDLILAAVVDSRLLKYVDPWGDAVFNHKQMDDLVGDLNDVRERHGGLSDSEALALARLELMIDVCRQGNHTYLWFIGD